MPLLPIPRKELRGNIRQWRDDAARRHSNFVPRIVPVVPRRRAITIRGENIILFLIGGAAVAIYFAVQAGVL